MEFVLSLIARPLALLLQLLYSLIGNYGISLIVLTTVIKLALYPSYKAQQLSTMGMQDLQPKMREIQNRYANFRIYDEKEYICTSFQEIFGQTYDYRYLSGYTY